MFTIDFSIRNTAFPVSVQRKTAEDAEALYQQIVAAMESGQTAVMQLECEGKTEKKIAVRPTEISAVQVSQKDGAAAAGGKPPGFAALIAE